MAKQIEYMTATAVQGLYDRYKRGETDRRGYLREPEKFNISFNEFINKLGKEGWEFFPDNGGLFGKREIPQERYSNHSESISR